MTDSTTTKDRFGAGICWTYMDKGYCPCDVSRFPVWHPRLSLAAPAATSTSAFASGSTSTGTVAIMPKRIPEWIKALARLGFVEGDPDNLAVLNTPYEEREEAKALGAVFSHSLRTWVVMQGHDLGPFAKWGPHVRNRGAGEVVMHSPAMNRATAARLLLRRCGFRPSHLEIRGNDGDSSMLRKEVSAMPRGGCAPDTFNLCPREPNEKRSAEFREETFADAKRRCFSTPESFVKASSLVANSSNAVDLSELLSTAKSSLVLCNRAGGICKEQKQFNEAIYGVMEALAAKLDSGKENIAKESGMLTAAAGPEYASQRQTRVTPPQKMGADAKALTM